MFSIKRIVATTDILHLGGRNRSIRVSDVLCYNRLAHFHESVIVLGRFDSEAETMHEIKHPVISISVRCLQFPSVLAHGQSCISEIISFPPNPFPAILSATASAKLQELPSGLIT